MLSDHVDAAIAALGPDEQTAASVIGTKDYWDGLYNQEMINYMDHSDPGDIWFGKKLVTKIVFWIKSRVPSRDTINILDLGCGNGHLLYALHREGFNSLYGIDYSEHSIKMVEKLSSDLDIQSLEVYLGDVTKLSTTPILPSIRKYNVIIDKGTYDAIMLNPDRPFVEIRSDYLAAIRAYINTDGFFIIASCNWTKEELVDGFVNRSSPFLQLIDEIETPKFAYGGGEGTIVTCLIFQKI